jgi:hypothetical protein
LKNNRQKGYALLGRRKKVILENFALRPYGFASVKTVDEEPWYFFGFDLPLSQLRVYSVQGLKKYSALDRMYGHTD